MGADSKHLSRALLLLAKDVHGRGTPSLRHAGRYAASSAQRTQHTSLSFLSASSETISADSWFLKVSRRWQEKKDRLISLATEPTPPTNTIRTTSSDLKSSTYEKLLKTVADKLATGMRQPLGPGSAHMRPRRWISWKPASSWDFPTLNASFPFTIPSIPVRLFLVTNPSTHSGAMPPGGVIMPAGLGTSARKFHSMSLTRQPGVPFDSDNTSGSALVDPALIAAQILMQADAVTRALYTLREKASPTAAHRRSDGSGGNVRSRVAKNFMFTHAATGIPKFQNRIPLSTRKSTKAGKGDLKSNKNAHKETRYPEAIDPSEEELATSAGEDAFFHRSDALGIADGVGGWAGVKDADPSLFARRLMHHVSVEIQRYDDIDDEMFTHYYEAAPVDVLRRAYEITLDEMETLAVRGSSTACVVVLRGDELRVANLGDCGLTVVRQGDMVYRTEEQQHSFNYPYQLSTEAHTDGASDAQVFRLKIQKGDIIIVGSDGVFDNLFDEDILEEVNHHLPPIMRADGQPELKYSSDSLWYESQQQSAAQKIDAMAKSPVDSSLVVAPAPGASNVVAPTPKFSLPQFHVDPKAISLAIAKRAKLVSEDARYTESPFQMRAIQEGLYYQGGKRDDITVIVAVVTDLEDTPDRR